MQTSVQFLLIDPQNDFCDLPVTWLPPACGDAASVAPALPVSGAHADMLRLSRLIDVWADAIGGITVTLDSHHRLDIAHPTFWRTAQGGPVLPFTSITAAQVRQGQYLPRDPQVLPRTLAYLDGLEQRGRYTLMVWPVHCEIGSWGHNVHGAVKAAYNRWEDRTGQAVQKIGKGSNPWTEHYSALQAEVPDPGDPGTQLNRDLLAALDQAELLVVAGEASSHCVKATVEHLAAHLPSGRIDKLVLLTDCMSPVAGFQAQADDFIAGLVRRGARALRSTELPSLLPIHA